MKDSRRSFSTFRGSLFILGFFSLLVLYPLLTESKTARFDTSAMEGGNLAVLPLDAKVTVYRDSTGKFRKSKITLRELVANSPTPILINFWATWCPPCLEELPSVELLHKQLKSQQTTDNKQLPRLITISVDDRIEDISKLESTLDFKPTFTVMHDKEGELARSLGTTKFPETYLINAEGKILYKWLGPQDWLSFDALQQIKTYSK